MNLPKKSTVHGFAWLPSQSADAPAVIAYTPDNHLTLYSSTGEEIWSSTEPYGGSTIFCDHAPMEHPDQNPGRTYLNPKINVADLDGDGHSEIVVVKNHEASGVVKSAKIKAREFRGLKAYL